MSPRMASNLARLAAAGLVAAGACSSLRAETQNWNYKTYLPDKTSGRYSKEKFLTSTISLTEQDGKAMFRMTLAGRGDPCISRGDLPAEVERGADTLTITVTPPLAGCEPFRYVIRNDGSGGVRMNRRGERWVPDGLDHDLTPAK
ncbi:MAG: hypothetical protein U1E89_08925 [Burkholderiaceae bacterium]